jgi:hypothetical protein
VRPKAVSTQLRGSCPIGSYRVSDCVFDICPHFPSILSKIAHSQRRFTRGTRRLVPPSSEPLHHLDLGIATARGCFEVSYGGKDPEIKIFKPERALAAFLIRLLARLQALGTVPAIDYDEYGRLLEIETP